MTRKSRQQPAPNPWLQRGRKLMWPLLLTLMLVGGLGLLIHQMNDPQVLPVRVVGVDGEITYLDRQRLEAAVAEAVDGSFFSVNLDHIRAKLEQLPWVESSSVRRVWPDTLRVRVVEQVPLAYWGNDGLVSQRGEVFRPAKLPKIDGLAKLVGDDASAPRITREYLRMRSLLETVGLGLEHVWVDARQAWRLQTDNDVSIILGRRDVMPRLTRFVQLYPYLQQQMKQVPEAVDLRYTNGFTVRWREADAAQVNFDSRSREQGVTRIAGI
jgi:cell division protein FtsQ